MPRAVSLTLELLETFVLLLRNEGNAARTARQLQINQPSMSKRLRYLQYAGRPLPRPWLERHGKRWVATEEGARVLPAVQELIDRYRRLTGFVQQDRPAQVRFACGQRTILGLVRRAVGDFRRRFPEVALRLSTLRGSLRIERVATGLLDLALVTHDERKILEIARRPLHAETLTTARLVLICAREAPWSRRVRGLPKTGAGGGQLAGLPLIVPEPDSGARKAFEAALGRDEHRPPLDVVLEIGGWEAIETYTRAGLGVGLVSEDVVTDRDGLIVRPLDPVQFPPLETRLICRRLPHTEDLVDLTPEAAAFRDALRTAARRRSRSTATS